MPEHGVQWWTRPISRAEAFPAASRRPARTGLLAAAVGALPLGGCSLDQYWTLRPQGPIAAIGLRSIIVDVATMMLIIGPTVLLLLWCLWRYRRASGRGTYAPDWSHSLPVEIVSWGFPLAIVAFLSVYTYRTTFLVNPFDPGAIARGRSADADQPPVEIDVVTTDWRWLFIYPDRHVAVANELVIPAHTPIRFRMTSATVPNDFFIPQLAGEIDIMPGMQTRQALIADHVGTFQGIAADFSGPGFSWMQFATRVVSADAFAGWVAQAARSPLHLDQAAFDGFAVPTINTSGAPILFSAVQDGLFDRVIRNVMMGKVYPTPGTMTEKKASYLNDRQQQDRASAPPPSEGATSR